MSRIGYGLAPPPVFSSIDKEISEKSSTQRDEFSKL
jgi:hypothetical protein